ncbi:WD40-repeat-containing domain protein [Tribonema minus]|uniref:WD40-repeat-containing domain protein n=1 Tax=Tribonema minus TaxID=303371 RepID=A0A835ZHR6_9STRA|nr:WD40-repeat-containing domain protein [Tribonema minus]
METGLAYSASRDTTLAQWGQGEGPLATYRGHTLTVSALDLSADETHLWSGSRDTSVRLWDVSTGQQRGMVATPRNLVTCLKCMPGEEGTNVVVQGGEDLKLRLWDFRTPSSVPAQTLDGFVYFPLCLDVSEDGNYLLTGSKGFNSVGCEGRLWDRRTGQVVQEYNGHAQDVTACLLAPAALAASSGGAVITASKDQTIKARVWGRESGQLLSDFAEPHRLCAATFTGGLYDLQLSEGEAGGETAAPVLSVASSVAGQRIE